MLASIVSEAGYKVGLYTSPHLISPRERIRIGNHLIKEVEFAYHLARIKSIVEALQYDGEVLQPTFFEIYTALAFEYFCKHKVEIAVVEVGLGGRLDATNVIEPLVGIITPVSLDHTRQLGNELTSIAREKAGIIKSHSRVIISQQKEKVTSLLQEICLEREVSSYQVGKDITFRLIEATPTQQRFQVHGLLQTYPHLFLPLAGEHQLWNAATAIGAVELLGGFGFQISPQHIEQGLKTVRWPGRLQIISPEPLTFIDCAHNASSAESLAQFLRRFYSNRRCVMVLAVLKHKDVKGIARVLCPLATRVITTCVNSPRALPITELYTTIKPYCRKKPLREQSLQQALDKARHIAGKQGVVCATGSVYLVGEILRLVGNTGQLA